MASIPNRLEDTGNVRRLSARWIVTGELTLETAAHLGEGEGDTVDMVVLKEARNSKPFIPGTSLAGALRSYLADILGGYYSKEHEDVARLFGGKREDIEGSQSPLIVFDALGSIPEGLNIEIRDGVKIDSKYGVAEPHKKFDFEVLPAGTKFNLRFDLLIPQGEDESFLLSLLLTSLRGFEEGDIHLGKRRSRGLGKVKVRNWQVRRFDLSSRDGWLAWALSDHEKPNKEEKTFSSLKQALTATFPVLSLKDLEDQRRRFMADLELEVIDDLLIRSPGLEPRAPDAVHLQSAGRPVLPGTSLAGALRQHALKIACLIHGEKKGKEFVNKLFGPENGESPCASRLRISESFVYGGSYKHRWRIAVDRFTGGVIKGALFDELVHRQGRMHVRLEIRTPSDGQMGLVLLLIRDLLAGEVPVGGSVSVGRGVLSGTATLTFPDGQKVRISNDLSVKGPVELLDRKIKAFQEEKVE